MALKIIQDLEQYDKETKGNLALDFIQEVFRNISYCPFCGNKLI